MAPGLRTEVNRVVGNSNVRLIACFSCVYTFSFSCVKFSWMVGLEGVGDGCEICGRLNKQLQTEKDTGGHGHAERAMPKQK